MSIEALYRIDSTLAVQRLISFPGLDLVMEALTTAGEGWFLALLVVALAWKVNPERRDALRSAIRGLAVLALTGALVVVTKRLVCAPRPLQVLGPARVHVLLEPLRRMSFPSGHSAAVAALAMWVTREPSVGTRWWPWLFAFLCGLSRVYVGAHWVTDVVAGWLLGIAVAATVCRVWRRPRVASAGLAGLAGACMGSAETPARSEATKGNS